MSSFKIPSPWQSDYAIPGYVRSEGLGMRTHTTKWTPRGVYDDPDAMDPSWEKSWAVPQYVKDEGYGQGTYVTEWAPRGFYVGVVRSCEKRIQKAQRAMKDTAGNGAFGAYGRRAAAVVLGQVSMLPPQAQKPALQKIMTAIDPALYQRTQQHAKEYVKAGHHPRTALELGLARAMTTGIGEEVVATGKRRRVTRRGQVALALGASPGRVAGALAQPPPSEGQCSADGKYVWVAAQGATPGYWQRLKAGETCSSFTAQPGPVVTTHPAGGGGGVAPSQQFKILKAGPFLLPDVAKSSTTIPWAKMTPEQQTAIAGGIAYAAQRALTNLANWDPLKWPKLSSIVAGWPDSQVPNGIFDGTYPLFRFKHPTDGKNYGVFVQAVGTPQAQQFRLSYREYETGWAAIWSWLQELAASVIDFVSNVIDTVGGLACQLLSSQAAYTAGAAAAASQGAPPQAGTEGVSIIQQGCQGGTPPPPEEDTSSSWVLPVAIGGGILLAGILLSSKKKRQP